MSAGVRSLIAGASSTRRGRFGMIVLGSASRPAESTQEDLDAPRLARLGRRCDPERPLVAEAMEPPAASSRR